MDPPSRPGTEWVFLSNVYVVGLRFSAVNSMRKGCVWIRRSIIMITFDLFMVSGFLGTCCFCVIWNLYLNKNKGSGFISECYTLLTTTTILKIVIQH